MKTIILISIICSLTLSLPCFKGQTLCNDNKCHPTSYIEGCFIYTPSQTCAQCEYNYQLNNGICLYSPQSTSSNCCLKFDKNSQCLQCSKGLVLNAVSGLCEDKKIEGCLQKNLHGCSICASSYELINGMCIKAISNCNSYNRDGSCAACASNSNLYKGTCIPLISFPTADNCKTPCEYGCAQCNQGYRLDDNGSCKPLTIAGCIKYNSNGECVSCLSPNYFLYKGMCGITGCSKYDGSKCIQCQSALGFQFNNGVCQIPNCIYFTNNGCSLCKNGLAAGSWGCKNPSQQICVICKADEFKGKDGKCYKKDTHCTKYANGVCVSCCDDYYISSNGQCQVKQYGCVYQNGVCASCITPFIFQNNQCIINGCLKYSPQGCQQCDSRLTLSNYQCTLPNCKVLQGFTCKECVDGYLLNSNGICIQNDPYCEVKNSFNKCMKCKEGYHFGCDGRCEPVKFGCNYVNDHCTSCRAPFIYVPETQSCIIDGCLSYFLGGCDKCANGYTLLYNSCKLPNCLISKNGKCLQCDPDFIFTSDGRCLSKDEYCQKFDANGKCLKCMSTYQYSEKQQKCFKKAPGCIYDLDDKCCSCEKPFIFDQGRCIIEGCLTYFQNGCSQCSYPYQVNSQHICEIPHCVSYKSGKCIGCSEGYALSRQYLCQLQDQYCLTYNSLRTQCVKCVKGYRLDRKGKCQYGDQYCSQFDSYGLCINCDRLYFLNSYGKCQLREPQCLTYTNGFCTECMSYYFVNQGTCMANLKGCKVQKSYNNCLQCESGYIIDNGVCKQPIKRLSWNSFDMNFFDSDSEEDFKKCKEVFSIGVESKLNLIPAIAGKTVTIIYSSSSINNANFQVDSEGNNGWKPNGQASGAFIGITSTYLQTYYALDIKSLQGSTLNTFYIQFSIDGNTYQTIDLYQLDQCVAGSVKTYYFKPVYAKSIRIVVKEGTPNIKFEFYFSNTSALTQTTQQQVDTYIAKTVLQTIDGQEGGVQTCQNGQGCWAGVETCEPKKVKNFKIIYTNCTASDKLIQVKIDYSIDGHTFKCWNNCQAVKLTGQTFTFDEPILAQKVRVHFSSVSGHPTFGIKFSWVD